VTRKSQCLKQTKKMVDWEQIGANLIDSNHSSINRRTQSPTPLMGSLSLCAPRMGIPFEQYYCTRPCTMSVYGHIFAILHEKFQKIQFILYTLVYTILICVRYTLKNQCILYKSVYTLLTPVRCTLKYMCISYTRLYTNYLLVRCTLKCRCISYTHLFTHYLAV
jgi:hypothetical protein